MKIPCPSSLIPEALRIVRASYRPAPRELIAQAIAKLRVLTVRRETNSDVSADIEMAVLADELLKYPADVAISVLGDWPDDKHNEARKWFPSWAELKDRLDRAASGRRMIEWQLMRQARDAGLDTKPKALELHEESPEHRAAVVEKCLASLGMAVKAPGGERRSGRLPEAGSDAKIRNEAQARLDALEAEKPPLPKLSETALKAAGLPVKRPEEND